MGATNKNLDYDYIVIGSGFGGSVSAMRLSQKGYRVAVIESGKRWTGKDFPKTNWNAFKFFWFPKLFMYGIQRINLLNHVMILSGAGVGGGSLVYANTLYVPKPEFFRSNVVQGMGGEKKLMPFYKLAERMLGVTQNPRLWEVDQLMKDTAADFGVGDSFTPTPVGIYFGDRETKKDPYFGGEGPERLGCNFCGGCMVGCRFDSKNTLDKNYLYFAERLGAEIIPEARVVDVLPLDVNGEVDPQADGSHGYEVRTVSTTGWFGSPRRIFRTKGVVFSAGVLGTVGLLAKLKQNGRLARLSPRLGSTVRTNSESIVGVTVPKRDVDFSRGIAITSSVHLNDSTHIEPVRYAKGQDAMGSLATIMTDGGGNIPRPLRFVLNALRNPLTFLRTLVPFGFAQKSIILLVMQSLDNSIHLVRKRRWIWPFRKTLTSDASEGSDHIPTYIPEANDFARRLAARTGGYARSSYNEVLLDVPTTAHILGGACMGATADDGVIDLENHVHGYENMLVCDGSMIPANPGVNPSLSITALSERAMSLIPPKAGVKDVRHFGFEKKWKVTGTLTPKKTPARKKAASKKKKATRR